MEDKYSSGTSIDYQQTIRRCIPNDRSINNGGFENLKSYNFVSVFILFFSVNDLLYDNTMFCYAKIP
jgi:hypothetical protein